MRLDNCIFNLILVAINWLYSRDKNFKFWYVCSVLEYLANSNHFSVPYSESLSASFQSVFPFRISASNIFWFLSCQFKSDNYLSQTKQLEGVNLIQLLFSWFLLVCNSLKIFWVHDYISSQFHLISFVRMYG